jgi:hypothetical protein
MSYATWNIGADAAGVKSAGDTSLFLMQTCPTGPRQARAVLRAPRARARSGGQAAHGGVNAPTCIMIDAMSSAAHSSLILPSVTR